MREAKTRKYHSPEYKTKVGLEALRGVKTINEIGQGSGGMIAVDVTKGAVLNA